GLLRDLERLRQDLGPAARDRADRLPGAGAGRGDGAALSGGSRVMAPYPLPLVGQRVLVSGDHTWAGHTGTVLRHEHFRAINREGAVVDLDVGGVRCAVFGGEAHDWEAVSAGTTMRPGERPRRRRRRT